MSLFDLIPGAGVTDEWTEAYEQAMLALCDGAAGVTEYDLGQAFPYTDSDGLTLTNATMGSTYWENTTSGGTSGTRILYEDSVPVMTSDTAPEGAAFCKNFTTSYDPYRAFDNSSVTGWFSQNNVSVGVPIWVGYSFGESKKIGGIALEFSGDSTYAPEDFLIQYTTGTLTGSGDSSNADSLTWVTEETITGADITTKKYYTFDAPVDATAVRINISAVQSGSNSAQLSDFEIFEMVSYGDVSYDNENGDGDRTTTMSATNTASGFLQTGTAENLIDGAVGTTDTYFVNEGSGSFFFDFEEERAISQIEWVQQTAVSHGTFEWYGSDDEVDYTLIGSGVLGATTTSYMDLSPTQGYRYYELRSTGTLSSSPYLYEINFKIGSPDEYKIVPPMTSNSTTIYGKTYVSSGDDSTYAWRAFNEDESNWFSSGGVGAYLQIQLPEAQASALFKLQARPSASPAMPTGFTIKGSSTGSFSGEETTLVDETGLTWTNGEWKEFTSSDDTTEFTYYRFTNTETSGTVYVENFQPIAKLGDGTPASADAVTVEHQAFTSTLSLDACKAYILVENVDSVSTDLTVDDQLVCDISTDNGSTFTEVALSKRSDLPQVGSAYWYESAALSFTSQTGVVVEIKTQTGTGTGNPNVKAYAMNQLLKEV